ncbi:DNA-binding transcriptional regulator, PucR family [Sinosporangium album]|uniref:DNA-binding transcriptional regulator, PucR family n=1 Tax=Sinosporangium album TaxID=504805 RepID=A0A1G7YSM2_9ACTN|nr:helix-turn-helix domain-containing protein [Sinosporangium album]SDG99461.1 DNA-binding transcriptional regulator, PucR family [Sinosporangium album]
MLNVGAIVQNFADQDVRDAVSGGEAALGHLVGSAVILSRIEEIAMLSPGALVIVPKQVAAGGDVALDLILRRAAAARASCVVVDAGTGELPTPTRRLAEQFQIALWREPGLDPGQLYARVEQLVRNPELVGARVVRTVSGVMVNPARDVGELVERLARVIAFPVALIGLDGHSVAGPALAPADELAQVLSSFSGRAGFRDAVMETGARESVVVAAGFPLATGRPRLWLGARVPYGLDAHSGYVLTSLRIASLALSAHLAQASLTYERENREAGILLDELLRKGDGVALADIERAAALGWQLVGWHVAVQVRASSSLADLPPATLTRSLAHALAANSVPAQPVDTGQAFVFWTTTTAAPGPERLASLVDGVRAALGEVERGYPRIRLRAGIGEPHEGPRGIALSLGDARHALAFAEARQGRAVVQRSDAMTANRLVRTWLPDGAARDVVASLTDPIRDADPTGQLITTLRTFLDNESNVSKSAAVLHLHRNTVIQRLQRIRSLLTVDLDDPNDRLALRLALRLTP